jgi:hypothetical protein
MLQDTLIVGDTLDFITSVPSYLASAGYTLKYRLVPRVSGTPIMLTSTASGDDYRITAIPTTTAGWVAGEYTWSAWVEKSGERHTVDSGTATLKVNPETIAAYDGRTQALIALADAKTALANFQSTGGRVKRYAIAGREMEFDDAGDILTLVNYWQIQVMRENAAAAVAAGQPDPRRIMLRMSNA